MRGPRAHADDGADHNACMTTRMLNFLYTTFPPKDVPSRHPKIRAALEKLVGGSPL